MTPEWLPSLLRLNGPSLQSNIDELYKLYQRDFIVAAASIVDGSLVYVNTHLDKSRWGGVYPHGFTHMVTRGKRDRTIDYGRARKLPWVKAVLDNYTEPEVTAFWVSTPEGDKLFLWLQDLDFVVIVCPKDGKQAAAGQKRVIVTAYNIDQHWMRRDLQKKYGNSFRQLQ